MTLCRRSRLDIFLAAGILASLLAGSVMAAEKPEKAEGLKQHAVIIRAAGYIPGTQKPEGPDAITHATSKPGNTYVFTDNLVEKLKALGVETKVADFSQCKNLECLYLPDVKNPRQIVDIVIFAGPAYYSKLPTQLLNLVPGLKEIVQQKPELICSSLTSAKNPASGQKTMMDFDKRLQQAGAKTVPGIVLVPDVEKEVLDKKTEAFALLLTAGEQ